MKEPCGDLCHCVKQILFVFGFQVKGDGNCMMRSMIDHLSFVDSKDMDKYQTYYLRCQVVAHFIKFQVMLKDWLKENVQSLYGGGEKGGDGGPFSMMTYLKYIVKDKVWGGDSIFIGLVASM